MFLKSADVSEMYSWYGLEMKRNGESRNDGLSPKDQDGDKDPLGIRRYPYENKEYGKYGKLMESDEDEGILSRVTHKRLLPCMRRSD